jgi:hypothetical protein
MDIFSIFATGSVGPCRKEALTKVHPEDKEKIKKTMQQK